MNQRGDSGKKNLSKVALRPRNNKACWLLSHTAHCDVTHELQQNAARAGNRALFEQQADRRNLAAQTCRRLFSEAGARNGCRPARHCANKTSPVAVARLMLLPRPGFKTGTRFARDFSLRWISSSSMPVWSSSRPSARCWSACRRATRPARGRGGRTPGIAARAAPSS